MELFPFDGASDLIERMGTSRYMMPGTESGWRRTRWTRSIEFRKDMYTDEAEELGRNDSPATDPFHPDPLDLPYLLADSNTISIF